MTKKIHQLWAKTYRSEILRKGMLVVAFNGLTGFFGYLYQIVVGRMLTPGNYAELMSIVSLCTLLLTPIHSLFIPLTRKITWHYYYGRINEIYSNYRKILYLFLFISIPIVLFLVCNFSNINVLGHSISKEVAIFSTLILVINSVFMLNYAYMQGIGSVTVLCTILLGSSAVKVLLSMILIQENNSLNSALLANVAATFVGSICGWIYIQKNKIDPGSIKMQFKNLQIKSFEGIIPIFLSTIAFGFITQLDVVTIKMVLPSDVAGKYIAAATIGKAILYIPGAVIMVLFPRAVIDDIEKKINHNTLWEGIILSSLIMLGISFLYFIFSSEIIYFLYGDRYLGAGNILKYYGFCIIPIAISFLIENYLIAIRKILFVWIIAILSPIQFILVYKIFHTPSEILSVIFIFGVATLLSGIIILLQIIHKERGINGRFNISNTPNV